MNQTLDAGCKFSTGLDGDDLKHLHCIHVYKVWAKNNTKRFFFYSKLLKMI